MMDGEFSIPRTWGDKSYFDAYDCPRCGGSFKIDVIKQPDKGTVPMVEFCPFCMFSIDPILPRELQENEALLKDVR